jgi:hypothetical protein
MLAVETTRDMLFIITCAFIEGSGELLYTQYSFYVSSIRSVRNIGS